MTSSNASSGPGLEKITGHDKSLKPMLRSQVTEAHSELDEDLAANPFLDPKVAAYYVDLYEKSQYECRDAFDPDLEWDTKEERQIVRKLDWHVCTWACIMFFALQVDRGNLKQAVSADMLEELGLSTNDYNYGM